MSYSSGSPPHFNFGRKHPNRKKPTPFTPEHRANMSRVKEGILPKNFLYFQRLGQIANKGIKRSAEWCERNREKGLLWAKMHPVENPITPINQLIRVSGTYKRWRESVFARDGYRCLDCGLRGGWNKELRERVILNADHLYPFSLFPRLRFAIENGRTLCLGCHKKTKTWGINARYANATK